MPVVDTWSAICWIIEHQSNRRNMTEIQAKIVKGKYYEAKKHIHGGTGANRYTVLQRGENHHSVKSQSKLPKVRAEVAKKFGTTDFDIKTSYELSRGMDAIKAVKPERNPENHCDRAVV